MQASRTSAAILFASSALAAVGLAAPARADTAAAQTSATVAELTVTAERREERAIDVPATVTAISGVTLKDRGIADMQSIIQQVPNAVLPNDPENFETYINIRGIHQADINAEPNFGLYRNGIFSGGERANLGAQVDIDRVEVLSGPQSGLYGRDAVGGVVNVVYAMPTLDSFHGYAIASYGNWEHAELQGAVNIPISSTFAVRAAGWWFDQEQGQLYNEFLKQYIDRYRDGGGRLSARWQPTDNFSAVWTAEYQDRHGPSFEAFAPNGITNQFGVQCCGFPSTGPETIRTIQEDTPNIEHWAQIFVSQDLTYDTKSWAGVFELVAAYKHYGLHLQEDQDHTAFGPLTFPMDIMSVQYRDEKLHNYYVEGLWKSPTDAKFSWIVGVDYFNEDFKFDRIFAGALNFNLLNTPFFGSPFFTYGNLFCSFLMAPFDGGCEGFGGFAGLPGAGAGSFPYLFPNIGTQSAANAFGLPGSSIGTDAVSGFGTATYRFDAHWRLAVALRGDWLQKHLDYSQGPMPGFGATALGSSFLIPLFGQIFPPFHDVESKSWTNFSPSVNLQYNFSRSANVYVSYATGFRAGGFNLSTSSPQFLPYGPEKDWSVEFGAKTLWLNGRLMLNGDVFYMRQSDLVETETDPTEPAFLGLYFLANVGTARTYGVEFQAAYAPVNWLNLGATVGWLDDRLTSGSSHGVSVVGQHIPLTRNWTVNLNGAVDYPLTDKLRFVGDVNLRLEYGGWLPASTGILETTPYQDFQKLDIDAGLAFDKYRVIGFVKNATNKIIPQFQYADGVENVNDGRTYGVRLEARF